MNSEKFYVFCTRLPNDANIKVIKCAFDVKGINGFWDIPGIFVFF